tara:strand:- start:678 stop:941 length:264 start_codon:yes stop_codon:yes gene_type:complete
MVNTVVKDSKDWVASKWQNRMVQVSVYAGILFYVVANPSVFKFMQGFLPGRINNMSLLLVHSILFAILMYVGTRAFFDPVLSQLGLR